MKTKIIVRKTLKTEYGEVKLLEKVTNDENRFDVASNDKCSGPKKHLFSYTAAFAEEVFDSIIKNLAERKEQRASVLSQVYKIPVL
jgi:hypothetical protein